MSSRFKYRKASPEAHHVLNTSSSTKKIVLWSSVLIIGSAVIYYFYSRQTSQNTKPQLQSVDSLQSETNASASSPTPIITSFASQSKYERKLSKFESKREKLIEKNPRLRSERDIAQHLREQKKQFKMKKLKYSYFEREYKE
eukprot:327622_1